MLKITYSYRQDDNWEGYEFDLNEHTYVKVTKVVRVEKFGTIGKYAFCEYDICHNHLLASIGDED